MLQRTTKTQFRGNLSIFKNIKTNKQMVKVTDRNHKPVSKEHIETFETCYSINNGEYTIYISTSQSRPFPKQMICL